MKNTIVATIVAAAPTTLEIVAQKNWMQVKAPTGVKAYISQPNKSGVCTRVHLSGWGYSGLPQALALPPAAVKPLADNGAVSLEIDLTKAPADWLAKMLAALPTMAQEQDPRRVGTKRGNASTTRPATLGELLASRTTSAAVVPASSPTPVQDTAVDSLDDMLALQGYASDDDSTPASSMTFADD